MVPVEELSAVEQISFQYVERLHSVLHHELELTGLGAVGKGSDIGTYGHRHTVLQLAAKFLRVIVEELVLARGSSRRAGVRGEIFLNGKGRHGVDLLFTHQAHGLITELVSMVDRGYSSPGGVQRAGLPFAVHGDARVKARGFGNSLG